MKKILIIYPHFPPSNLAGVHRPRIFAGHLPAFGWAPVILTVHERYYEEEVDHNLSKLLPPDLRIEKVNALPVLRPRVIGDIGLRAFFALYRRAKKIIRAEQIDFVYIPIPSFYCSLLGRVLHESTGVRYGIDYIDPWVHVFPGSELLFSRHWLSTRLAKFLEPIAVKKASLVTGVAAGYYLPVLQRNPKLKKKVVHGAMPYGGEAADHQAIEKLHLPPYLFSKNGKQQLVYAGALLPKAYQPLEAVFAAIRRNLHQFGNVEFHFIGTGRPSGGAVVPTVKPLAEKYGLWQQVVFEHPERIPYLDVLVHLKEADGVFILGSTEPHYTPSKTYQAVLSNKPVLAVLHKQSTAAAVLQNAKAGVVLAFDGENDVAGVEQCFPAVFNHFRRWSQTFHPANVDRQVFAEFSARSVTEQLANLLNRACE